MKKLITILSAILFAGGLLAQAPYKMSYQTVIRDGGGALVTSQQVGIKISILRGSATGTVSYSEIFNPAPKTNANGLLSLEIGTGVAVTGMIDTINWEDGLYFIMTETDPSGGSSYSITGTSQLLSVPFAFSAANGNWKKSMNNISNSNTGNIGIGTNAPAAKLDVIGNMKITDGTEGTGKVLTSDYNGFASWTNPSVIETDPEVASSMVNKIARWNGTALVDGIVTDNGANVGIGTNTPVAKLDVAGTFKIADGTQGEGKLLTSDSTGFASWQKLTIVETDPEVNSSVANKVAKWNGAALVDGIMTDNGTNVGIGTNTPVAKLDVVGSLKVTNGSQGVGKVLTSDAAGVASWVTSSTLETDPQVSNLVTNKIAKWNGTSLVDGIMTDNGTYIGIGTNTPNANLDLVGTFQYKDGTQGTGKFLISNATGVATWANPATVETDPQVGSSGINKVAKWNGTSLVDGIMTDNGTYIGIGTINPNASLDLVGTFQYKDGSQGLGKLLTSNASGDATWVTPSAIETDPQVNSATTNKLSKWNGTALVDGIVTDNGTNIGIGTNTPVTKLDLVGNFKLTDGSQGIGKLLVSDAAGVASWASPSLAEIDPQVASNITNKLSKWNGTSLVDGIVTDNGTNIGIGTNTPVAKLDLVGNFKLTDGSQGIGKILVSDAAGVASWAPPSIAEIDPQVASTITNKVSKWNGTSLVDGIVTDNGTNIGIGTNTPVTKLDLIGNFKLTDGSQGLGKILVSDAAGVASWATASSVETDPQVTSNIANKVAKWNGTSLTDGMITDDGQFVGIGTTTPSAKLHVYGSIKYNDGNEATGKVLTSDVNGLASWQTPASSPTHYLGENYGGGIVFYVYDNGHHGLIAYAVDFTSSAQLYNGVNRFTGALGDGLGAGEMNTTLMVATQIGDPIGGGFAAKLCADLYSATPIIYGDWYLPSKYELNLLYENKNYVGGLSGMYWSSTEVDASNAFAHNFSGGGSFSLPKNASCRVRAIRNF